MFFISISFVSLPNAKRFKCFLYKASAPLYMMLYQLQTVNIIFVYKSLINEIKNPPNLKILIIKISHYCYFLLWLIMFS